ncbi:Hypothetical_protein [Hexamita inflata]|uniref:Hypothetical_protein n=1 Tax=Hexamita inflata TaxID=28002 RepID=A0ABP1H8E2_9EUKA
MKSNQSNETNVLNAISKVLCVQHSGPKIIIYNVMMLPDSQYSLLFYTLSLELNVQVSTVYELFTQMTYKYLHIRFGQQQPQTGQVIISNYQNGKNVSFSQFKLEFSQILRKIIMEHTKSNNITDKQVCEYLATYFSVHNQSQFWEHVHTKIPYKTSLQLKQYFQKSFSKCLFESINNGSRQIIMEMTQAMQQSKPSEIVDKFFAKMENKAYFRREVLMLVKYFQRVE